MTSGKFIVFIIFLSLTVLSGCGGGSGGDSSGAGVAITLTPSKTVGLADGTDVITVRADVKTPNGDAVADGTSVSFSAADSLGPISATSAATAGGSASFSLTHAALPGVTSRAVTVTAFAGGASGSTIVKFISQPTSVDIFIAFDKEVTNLSGLQFTLTNTAGASFDNTTQPITRLNAAEGALAQVAASFDAATNSTKIILTNASLGGFNPRTSPFIKATFAISSGLPQFQADVATAATFTAVGPDFGPTSPPVTAANLVITTTYNTER